jgi:hypothetical protein
LNEQRQRNGVTRGHEYTESPRGPRIATAQPPIVRRDCGDERQKGEQQYVGCEFRPAW